MKQVATQVSILESSSWLEQACSILQQGGVIAYPTESSYGLGIDIDNPEAIEKLYNLKGRPASKAIPLIVAPGISYDHLIPQSTPQIEDLKKQFWPGPLTLVLSSVNVPGISAGDESPTLAVRMTSNEQAQALINHWGKPLSSTSANLSGEPNAYTLEDLNRYFGDKIDGIFHMGTLPPAPVSTLINCTSPSFTILREGAISKEQLADYLSP